MKTLPYQQAFERVRAEFLDMPGMHLTPEQVERLSGVECATCKVVLDDLLRSGFLCIAADGSYCRVSDTSTSHSRPVGAEAAAAERQRPEHV
jgi:hypothetical protein